MPLETTLFPLDGLDSLSASYKLYSLKGMPKAEGAYHAAVNKLVRRLSFQYRAPFVSIMEDGHALIACPSQIDNLTIYHRVPPSMITLVEHGEAFTLSFDTPVDDLDPVRLRFLDFAIGDHLFRRHNLWQPRAGQPYFSKRPISKLENLDLFEGFSVRATRLVSGGFGLAIEAKSRFLSNRPIGPHIGKRRASQLEKRACVHKMGDRWYQFQIIDISDRTVGEPSILEGDEPISLIQYLTREAGDAIPPELANLKPDGAALDYFRGENEPRSAPAELCYLVEDTQTGPATRHQRKTILSPAVRRERIKEFVSNHLKRVRVNNVVLSVELKAEEAEAAKFPVPDLLFGNNHILEGSQRTSGRFDLRKYSKSRRDLMFEKHAGFVDPRPLPPQAVVMPESIYKMWGGELCCRIEIYYGKTIVRRWV